MCGLAGFVDFLRKTDDQTLDRMTESLNLRGPDDKGVFSRQGPDAQVGLAHTRLSVIDLSAAGHQPMRYRHFVIVYNGELYNYTEIKKSLENLGKKFQSNSDTEVILQAYEHWGKACVQKFIGMFAFAIYDEKKEELVLCRDRIGVKPLYFYYADDLFLFGSELKALRKHPRFPKRISKEAVYWYMQYSYVPGPLSIYEDCFKLEPGHWLTFRFANKSIVKEPYWQLLDYFQAPLHTHYEETKEELERLLISACNYRMVSDVPVGIFLSGGYDSSGIAALLQKGHSGQLKTFTIGFPDGISEAPDARRIAGYLGTDHCEMDCSMEEARAIVPDLPLHYDEPFADISAIPTIMVSRLARSKVTVALTGDGGDELFAGYGGFPDYFRMNRLTSNNHLLNQSASGLTQLASVMVGAVNPFHGHKLRGYSIAMRAGNTTSRLATLSLNRRVLPWTVNQGLFGQCYDQPDDLGPDQLASIADPYNLLLWIDSTTSLKDQLLVKTDRATMSASLEGREPLLDHRLAEFAARMPLSFKLRGNTRKAIFKEIVHKYIPQDLLNRPKVGFDLPLFDWLRGELSYLIYENLSRASIKKSGFFNEAYVEKMIAGFHRKNVNYNRIIWRLIQFQTWYFRWQN